MKSFVTGGAGFLGAAVVRRLVDRGDQVVGLVRTDEAATKLTRLGAVPVRGDVTDARTLDQLLTDVDLVFHIAGDYRIGIKEAEHEAMFKTNVDGTTLVLDAAVSAGVRRIVYVSTVGVFGNTRGKVVDETYERPDRDFLSFYDATKYMAHRVAVGRQAAGAPLVIAQPGAIYGPGDRSELGAQIDQAARGKYTIRAFSELGFTMGYVDDVADGVVLTQEKGAAGETVRARRRGDPSRDGPRHGRRHDREQARQDQAPVDRVLRGTAVRWARRPPHRHRAEPARGHPRQQGRHLLGLERQGRARAGVRAARTQAGAPRPPRGALTRSARRALSRSLREVLDQRLLLLGGHLCAAPDHVVEQRLRLRGAGGAERERPVGSVAGGDAAALVDDRDGVT